MNVASLELCRQLYELSGWDDCEWSRPPFREGETETYPAYDLGYLLRKLPLGSIVQRIDGCYRAVTPVDMDNADEDVLFEADTPEDAAAMLAIELFRQGVLRRDGDA